LDGEGEVAQRIGRPMTGRVLHHAAIQTGDLEASLRFWRDGLGLDVLMDHEFDGDWPTLLDGPDDRLRSIFLGSADHPGDGIVELVAYPRSPLAPGAPGPAAASGFLLLSFFVGDDLGEVVERLTSLGFEPARRITVPGPPGGAAVAMATILDPNGVMVELIGA
jgi:glyoxylase I family protein